MDGTFGVITKRYLPNMKSQRFSLMFFSKSFKVLHIFLWSILNLFLYMVQGTICIEVHF